MTASRYRPYMLRFRLFGIPVGVHASFLVIALLGATAYRGWDIAIWTAAAFVSILSHELGHALAARGFHAQEVNVTLYGLGGLTAYRHTEKISHGKSFLISAAGSSVGIALGGAVWYAASEGLLDGARHELVVFLDAFIFTSLVWGVLNWIPIVPLDGGHMVQHFAAMFSEEKAPLIGQIVTWVAVAVVVPYAWLNGYTFGALIVVVFAISGLRDYRSKVAARRPKPAEPSPPQPAPPAPPTPPKSSKPPPEFPI